MVSVISPGSAEDLTGSSLAELFESGPPAAGETAAVEWVVVDRLAALDEVVTPRM